MNAAEAEETILLVDDEDSVRFLVEAMLQHYGYGPLVASSSSEALELFRQHAGSIKLLLTDVIMPGMSGIELGEKLQSISPGLKIIYMSGYMAEDLPSRSSGSPEPVILKKPFSSDALIQRVREALA